jgi:hypothetical protein
MKRGPFAVVVFAVIAAVGVPLFASPQSVGIPMLLGSARTHCGHTVRLVAFASLPGHSGAGGFTFISLGQVEKFLEEYLREHWDVLCHAQFKDPAFGFEVLLEKARRGQTQDCS